MTCRRHLVRSLMLGITLILSNAATADDKVARKFGSGSSSDTVGIVDAVEDVELAGPEALTSDEQGNLFILDQINGRILRFNPKEASSEPDVLKLPDDIQPSDLVVRKSDILVWDGAVRTFKAADEPSTRGISGGGTFDWRKSVPAVSKIGSRRPR